jgi:hypothetical protein
MSGDPASDSEQSEAGLVLLSKPFSPQALAATLLGPGRRTAQPQMTDAQ